MTDAEISKWEAELRRSGIDAVRPDAADVLLLISQVRALQAEVARLTAALIDYDTGWREASDAD